jgi:hypothetical protein
MTFLILLLSFLLPNILNATKYRILEDVSFNLRDYRESAIIYNNYSRHGDSVILKNNLILAPRVNNTFGLIYTKHVSFNLS